MVPCLNQRNIYTKRKLRVWRDQKCIPLVGAKKYSPVPVVKVPRIEGGSRGPRTESYVNWDRNIPMEPCLHQGNNYTKRKLRVWRDQKCILLVGAKTILTCVGRENTPSRGRQYRVQNGKLRKLGGTYRHGTVFAPRQYLYQMEATGMERPEMYSASRCKNHTYLCGCQNTPSLGRQYRAQNRKLHQIRQTNRHGTMFPPRQ